MKMDNESRANRFVGALDGLASLFAAQVPGLPMDSEKTACLLSMLSDEAKIIARRSEKLWTIVERDQS